MKFVFGMKNDSLVFLDSWS